MCISIRMKTPTQSGFALLMTLIVVGVVLSIGLTILDVSIKQVRLSTNAKDSEIAFHAANAGMECARFVRKDEEYDMENGNGIAPSCFGVAANIGTNDLSGDLSSSPDLSGAGEVFLYDYSFTWGSAGSDRCTRVLTLVASSSVTGLPITVINVSNWIPGFPVTRNFVCESGSRCTAVSVLGYNKPCSIVSTAKGTVEREVLLQF